METVLGAAKNGRCGDTGMAAKYGRFGDTRMAAKNGRDGDTVCRMNIRKSDTIRWTDSIALF